MGDNMKYKYGELKTEQIEKQKKRLTNSIFRLLPMRENNYEYLDEYFVNLLIKIDGLNKLWGEKDPEIITLLALVEKARGEEDIEIYKKAVLNACSLVDKIRACDKAGE